jgi:hypothetical protein
MKFPQSRSSKPRKIFYLAYGASVILSITLKEPRGSIHTIFTSLTNSPNHIFYTIGF